MSESEDPAQAAERLEAAIERIAAAAGRSARTGGGRPAGQDDSVYAELTTRLDSLIARLRAALG